MSAPEPEAVTRTATPRRECGSCSLCCRVLSVDADDDTELTPIDEWCAHCEVGKGCTIYEQRPRTCRTYSCGWLGGMFDEEDRPDRSKLLASIVPMVVETQRGPVRMPVIELHECAPGALETARAGRMIAQAKNGPFPLALGPFDRSPCTIFFSNAQQRKLIEPQVAARLLARLDAVTATMQKEK